MLNSLNINLRDYQFRAIQTWESAGYRGIWSMATGTGKTLTALYAISDRINEKGVAVIIVPGQDLVDQWAMVVTHNGFSKNVVKCYSENSKWHKSASNALLQNYLGPNERRAPYLIATIATAISDDFFEIIRVIPDNEILLVGDEVHRLGAKASQRIFTMPAKLGRLGLSATPSRKWDEDGNRAIDDYFGGKIFEYNLQEALSDGWLCPYNYYTYLVGMTTDERANYFEFSDKIRLTLIALAKYYGLPSIDFEEILRLTRQDGNNQLELLLYARADIVKGADGKSDILRKLAKNRNLTSCLIYCNDELQVEGALKILYGEDRKSIGFTSARLANDNREKILQDFSVGVYDFIVAIKCLDEGIDIPDTRNAFIMASSKTEREWIQRRGRLLRKAPGKELASIYDCIVVPSRVDEDGNILDPISSTEVSIIRSELFRAREFAESALNANQALIDIENIRRKAYKVIASDDQIQ
jgi:superfamily II DNA or RNA helicase